MQEVRPRSEYYTSCLSIDEFDEYIKGRGPKGEKLDHVRRCRSCAEVTRDYKSAINIRTFLIELVCSRRLIG